MYLFLMKNQMTTHEAIHHKFRERYNILVVLGPTASGKTCLAIGLARHFGGEIISADSRQVYRGMDLGTGKDLREYERGGIAIPYHLIDVLDPSEEFSVFAYQEHFYRAFREIRKRGNLPILSGGSGLYLDSVIRGYSLHSVPRNVALRDVLGDEDMETLRKRYFSIHPAAHNTTDIRDRARIIRAIEIAQFNQMAEQEPMIQPQLAPLIIGIRCDRDVLRQKITVRLQARLEAGMVEEVCRLHAEGIPWERIDSFGLEYRYVGQYVRGESSFEEMIRTLNTRIHQFAKRQDTWFRRMEKKGVKIHWIDQADVMTAVSVIEGTLS